MSNQFNGSIGRIWQDLKPWWPQPNQALLDAPNTAVIVLDDVRYGQINCYGGPIGTPNIDKFVVNGLLYNTCIPTASLQATGYTINIRWQ